MTSRSNTPQSSRVIRLPNIGQKSELIAFERAGIGWVTTITALLDRGKSLPGKRFSRLRGSRRHREARLLWRPLPPDPLSFASAFHCGSY
jgi:hypothetical protein